MSIIAVFGPTASGKSDVARAIADRVPAELVSADSMQAYRGVPILTNQPAYPTHLVAIWPLDHEGSVGEYQQLAHAAIDGILARGKTPVVVGGTGLYLRAALAKLEIPPEAPRGLREQLERLYDALGPDGAHRELAARDAAGAAAIHAHDRRRVIRALELAELGSSLRPPESRLWSSETRHPTLLFGLELPREELARRIEARTQKMFEAGAEREARLALSGPISPTARYILGLREAAELTPERATEVLTAATRRYAAYQRKWMRRIPGIVPVRADRPAGEVAEEILAVAHGRRGEPTAAPPSL